MNSKDKERKTNRNELQKERNRGKMAYLGEIDVKKEGFFGIGNLNAVFISKMLRLLLLTLFERKVQPIGIILILQSVQTRMVRWKSV